VEWSGMDEAEAYRVFNMGIGMVLIVGGDEMAQIQTTLPEARVIGALVNRTDDAVILE
jgi:phosphoribosylformylglycinamidine cyclo-ligase